MGYYKLQHRIFLCCILFSGFCNFILSQGIWTKKADIGSGKKCFATGFSIGNKGYFGTGLDSLNNTSKDFWEWDQITDVWTQKADFAGSPRKGAVSFSIGNKGYVGTGYDGVTLPHGYTKDFWQYDPALNIWTQKADFAGTARELAVGFSINNKGYIGTGYDGVNLPDGVANDFWQWDETMNVWTQIAPFSGNARYLAVGFSIGNKGYIGTGMDILGSFMSDFWEWNQTTNVWTQKANFGGTGRYSACGFSIGSKGYIGTGRESNQSVTGYKKDFCRYDPATNIWSQQAILSGAARIDAFGFSIGNRGYIGAGQYNYMTQVSYKDFWEYDPNDNGINEVGIENLISIYPIPTSGIINVQSESYKIQGIEVYNTSGAKIYSSAQQGNTIQMDLTSQSNGVYFIHIICKEGTAIKKAIIIN